MDNNNNHTPPRLAEAFLLWFLKEELGEEVLGDLEEKFNYTAAHRSVLLAKVNYWYQVFQYLRPFAIRNYRSNSKFNTMYQHNFKISLRNILRNKGYSLINLSGLVVSMTVVILIGLWVYDELSFNNYHIQKEHIAQVMIEHHNPGEDIHVGTVLPPALGTLLKESYSTYFDQVAMMRSRPEERIFTTNRGHFAESGYFMQPDGAKMFGLNMQQGDINGLRDVNAILLSETTAQKLFGDSDPLNQIITMDGNTELTVAGVYEDLPHNSSFHGASYFAPLQLYISGWSGLNVWDNYFIHTYVKLKEHVNLQKASALIKDLVLPHTEGQRYLFLNPMNKWHLHSEFENGQPVTSQRLKFVWLFGAAAIFIVALACINFMNLSTAASEKRAKEIGIRKSLGSQRLQLMSQFLTEAFLLSFLSFLTAATMAALVLPWFNNIASKEIAFPSTNPWFWLVGFTISLITGILSGSYPAFYLSALNPLKSLKGGFSSGKKGALLRKTLVVFQFTISILLISGTFVVYQQVQHAKSRPTGYSKANLLVIPKRSGEMYGKYEALSYELKKSGAVIEVGEANYPITNTLGNNNGFDWEGKPPSFDPSFNTILVNHDYGKTIGWEVTEGRDFNKNLTSDISKSVIITESTKKLMGLENAVGSEIKFSKDYFGSNTFTIVGVVRDMIKGDPFQAPRPAIMFLTNNELSYMFVRLNPELPVTEALMKLEAVIKDIVPSAPFNYNFVDMEYNAKFRAEERAGKLVSIFAVLAIFISCLGMFGLVSFITEKRTREIGIRKVLGAPIASLWRMLSLNFIYPVVVACLIATPIAYYLLNNWLHAYDYKIEMSWWVFGLAGLAAIAVTMVTVSYRTIKAALLDPVKNLQSE
ncbi:ABC transporter permease [Fulvivirga kasyanovii]|uniref:FtsX-like permease family protein n=1 Tax=Fulvivirga kasyanovii TaxID=396812 RepID=A0ABW9RSZ7_9BACT|nr:ABC transporter permease [Fulvivirga kasyanovii]MTI27293.1 FtsX-like permease family protein [Fulvivirga kasyanovii]